MYLDRFWSDVCCRYTGSKVILLFQEIRPSESVHTHRPWVISPPLQGEEKPRPRVQGTLSCH